MTTIDPHRPVLGESGAACRGCGSELVEDQRYCLACGERRADARLPFLEILAEQAHDPRPLVTEEVRRRPASRAGVVFDRLNANTAVIAGVGCLLLAIALGYLIGHDGDRGAQRAASPPVIVNGGGAPAGAATSTAPAAAAADEVTGADTAADTAKAKKTKKASSAKPDDAKPAKQSKASKKALDSIENAKGGDYAKKAAKLPKVLETGGKPPPRDNKPAAAGESFEAIE